MYVPRTLTLHIFPQEYVYLCVPYGSYNEQHFFPPKQLVFVAETLCVSCEVLTEFWSII
jgi:hypothetical protein